MNNNEAVDLEALSRRTVELKPNGSYGEPEVVTLAIAELALLRTSHAAMLTALKDAETDLTNAAEMLERSDWKVDAADARAAAVDIKDAITAAEEVANG